MADADRPDYAERARMHDSLAAATRDPEARRMHQAMAAEFRRRARQAERSDFPGDQARRPIMELAAPPC